MLFYMTTRITVCSDHFVWRIITVQYLLDVWGHAFYFNLSQFLLSLYSPHLKKAVEAFSFGTQTCAHVTNMFIAFTANQKWLLTLFT